MSHFVFNKELTDEMQQEEKWVNYNNWLRDNGAIFPKIVTPAAFTSKDDSESKNPLWGVLAAEDIAPNEVVCYVPNKCIISTETARHSEIAEIFRSHDEVFIANQDRDYMVLVLFLMYERMKGEDGFWHPYFVSIQEIDLPAIWEDQDVAQIADSELVSRIRYFRG